MSTVTRVYKNVQGIRTAIKDVGRLRQILGVLVRHGFGALVNRLRIAETAGIDKVQEQPAQDTKNLSRGERVRMVIEDLGPTFIKLGQILSTRPDLIPADIIEQLQHLQDDVPPMEWDDVRFQIQDQLGKPHDELFAQFDSSPLACASMAQVHRARLESGEDVVVKVRRRHLAQRIDSDLNILHFLAAQAESLIPELKLIAPVGIVREFDKALRKELNFATERHHIKLFQKNFRDFEGIHIPAVYPEFCAEGVLTMEFIDGVKITKSVQELDADPYKLAPIIMKALFKMLLKDGVFHGDLHPGNMLITPNMDVALIDFGLVGRLLPQQRESIIDLLVGVSREDYEQVARSFFEMGVKVSGVVYDYDSFEAYVVEVMDKHLAGKTLADIDVNEFFADLVNGALKYQLKMPPTYTMVFKALMTIEGIGKTLAPDINFIEEAKPVATEMLMERYSPRRLLRESVEMLGSATRFLRQFSQSAPQLLRDIEQGRLQIQANIPQIQKMMESQHRNSRHMTRSILVSAFVVSGTLALDVAGPTILGVPAISAAAYTIGGIIGFPLFLSLFKIP